MGLISFIKDAGKKLFDRQPSTSAAAPATQRPDQEVASAITNYIKEHNIAAKSFTVTYEHASGTVILSGEAPDQATREKLVLLAGNVQGVEKVDDRLTVERAEPEAQFHTVKSGDNLSKISKQYYGDANRYREIFEANKPMLKDPDEIYPGQVLRIPAAKAEALH
jgi:nucleoid-associated protein YgaU